MYHFKSASCFVEQIVTQCAVLTLIIAGGSYGIVRAYPYIFPPPFGAEVAWAYFSSQEMHYSSSWFAFMPDKKETAIVNMCAYVRIFNGAKPTVIQSLKADARVDKTWVPLVLMPDEDGGIQYYFEQHGYGVGWPLSKNRDIGVETETSIQPNGSISGWAFFAYPHDLPGRATKIRVTVTDLNGYMVTTEAGMGADIHGPLFPDKAGPPTDLRRYPWIYYVNLK